MEIYDTTLRDGTQCRDVSLNVGDKLQIVKILDDFGIDYIELGWPGSNPVDKEVFTKVKKLKLKHSKIVAFSSTKKTDLKPEKDLNLKAVLDTKVKYANLFGKTWPQHIKKQLKTTKEKNLKSISDSLKYLTENGLKVFFDAEHFFDGYREDKTYALKVLESASKAGAINLILCDTNGGILPDHAKKIVKEVRQYLDKRKIKTPLGVHFHNDSETAVANTLIVTDYVTQIQGTINGIGERTGNANLCSIIPGLMLKKNIKTNCNLKTLTEVSNKVNILTNLDNKKDQPYVGKYAFTHKGGVHVDALNKGANYEAIEPKQVGNKRDIVLSDLSGTANIVEVAKKFGIKVNKKDPRVKAMLKEVKELEKKGYVITDLKAEQYLLTKKHFGKYKTIFDIEDVKFLSEVRDSKDYNEVVLVGKVDGKNREVVFPVKGGKGGPVDAAYKCLRKMIATNYKNIQEVTLVNYKVTIHEDKGHESSVRVYIGFKNHGEEWACVGVNTNILKASLESIEKGFRYYMLKNRVGNI